MHKSEPHTKMWGKQHHVRWCSPSYKWSIIPLTIDISPINHQLSLVGGFNTSEKVLVSILVSCSHSYQYVEK